MSLPVSERIDGERRLKQNAKLYESMFGHKPLFTLTATGAQALLQYFEQNKTRFKIVGGACGYDHGVSANILRSFLTETFSQSFPALGAKTLSELLGVVSTGANVYGGETVAVDWQALKTLSESRQEKDL